MQDLSVIQGTFADLKTVKTRGMVQLVIEVPIEQGERVVRAFGFPQPGNEINVAVARIMPPAAASVPEEKPLPKPTHPPAHDGPPSRRFEDLSRAQQAGILCGTPDFQQWLCGGLVKDDAAGHTADMLRFRLGVQSRRELDSNAKAGALWDALVAEYRTANGQMAEMRG